MMPIKIKLDEDYYTDEKEIHLLDLFDLQYQERASVTGFYDQYRSVVIASLKKKGDIIIWQDSMILDEDEELSPTFEDFILATVLFLMDARLPGHVKEEYQITGKAKSLMDYRTDILDNVPTFLMRIKNPLPDVPKSDLDPNARYVGLKLTFFHIYLCTVFIIGGLSFLSS